MTKTLAIFGAGPGTGRALAERYASDGWNVALVARRPDAVAALAQSIRSNETLVKGFVADITDHAQLESVVSIIRDEFGRIDAVAFTPASPDAFTPAADLTSGQVRAFADLFLYPVIDVVQLVLEDLKASDSSAVLYVNGASALGAPPKMSGPAPSMAAARNYLQTLRAELAEHGVFVGAAFIAALIKGSAAEAAASEWGAAGDVPIVDPAIIAESIATRHAHNGDFEVTLPLFE